VREEVAIIEKEAEQALGAIVGGREEESTGPILYSNPMHSGVVEPCHQEEGTSTSGKLVSRSHTAVGHAKGVNCIHATERQLLSGGKGRF